MKDISYFGTVKLLKLKLIFSSKIDEKIRREIFREASQSLTAPPKELDGFPPPQEI